MKAPDRPVDLAMDEDRPEKRLIRTLWVAEVRKVAAEYPNSDEPWYLTLGGTGGYDIQSIIEAGLISMTEVNSIAEDHQNKIVAVERRSRAIAALQAKFVGLRIKQVDFGTLVHGEGQFAWPQGEDMRLCRARIVNLDLNSPLQAHSEDEFVFPVLEWIRKLCQIHARPPHADWTLCLTLHAEVLWPENVNRYARTYRASSRRLEPRQAQAPGHPRIRC